MPTSIDCRFSEEEEPEPEGCQTGCESSTPPELRTIHPVAVTETGIASESLMARVVHPWEVLVPTAEALNQDGYHQAAIVTVHTACEAIALRAIDKAQNIEQKNCDDVALLPDAVDAVISSYNLATDRIRNLYSAMTGHAIQMQPFWQGFTESAKLRNKIVHQGHRVSEAEAAESLRDCRAFIESVAKANSLKCEFETQVRT